MLCLRASRCGGLGGIREGVVFQQGGLAGRHVCFGGWVLRRGLGRLRWVEALEVGEERSKGDGLIDMAAEPVGVGDDDLVVGAGVRRPGRAWGARGVHSGMVTDVGFPVALFITVAVNGDRCSTVVGLVLVAGLVGPVRPLVSGARACLLSPPSFTLS